MVNLCATHISTRIDLQAGQVERSFYSHQYMFELVFILNYTILNLFGILYKLSRVMERFDGLNRL